MVKGVKQLIYKINNFISLIALPLRAMVLYATEYTPCRTIVGYPYIEGGEVVLGAIA